jgi:hypothetical protein
MKELCVCVCVFFCCKQNQHESLKLPIFFLVLRSFQWGQNVIDRETHTSPFISHPCWQLFDYHQWKLICMTSFKGRMTVNFWWTWNSCVGLFLWCCLIMAIFCCENNKLSLTKINFWWFFNEILVINLGLMMPH